MMDIWGNEVKLTRRELEVLRLLQDRRGLTYKQIGEELVISWETVRFHVHWIYDKLGVGGPGARARVMGMTPPPTPPQNGEHVLERVPESTRGAESTRVPESTRGAESTRGERA